ncbi:retrovirus-related Pol polyprotein from transposon opus [Nephila pilipes]|uniref:RNA-directed DNA polymerase n=1 Tax=Nephila pilipes TaxID=299642 RepID=A0A8X6M9J9_NEPPI|nr:retrovirus-related Pol polyprotein from transposon opus [Nephila pilipes]
MIVDTGANVTIMREDIAQQLNEKIIWTPPCVTLQTVTDSSLHSTTEDVTLFRKGVSEIKPCYRIIASSDFTIPARQELILKGYTDQEKNFRLGVLEFPDLENFPKGVLVASTLVDITKEAIPVRCANVSDKPKIIKKELTQKQRSAAEEMLREFKELFPKSSEEFRRTNLTKHRIDTGNPPPIKQHPRRLPFAKVEEVKDFLKDDIIIVGRDFEEQLNNLRKVLEKLKQANLKLNPAKCYLFRREVSNLGCIISAEGVRTDLRKMAAVKEWSQPRNGHELRSFLGLRTYYRRFVKGFSLIARQLHRLTEHKRPFVWSEECEVAFTSLKEALTSAPILSYPDRDKQFILDTDASHANVGAVLSQEIDGQERVIAYWTEMKCGKTVPVVRQITASATSHLDPWSDEEVREAQMKDPDLKPIIERMESSSVRPS